MTDLTLHSPDPTISAARHPLLHRFGLNLPELELTHRFLRLGGCTSEDLAFLEEVIRLNLGPIVDDFYLRIDEIPILNVFLADDATRERLKGMQRQYLLSLGRNYEHPDYVEGRLRIGFVHEHIGLPQRWYLASYAVLFEVIEAYVRRHGSGQAHVDRAVLVLHRLLCFDVALGVETYTAAGQAKLEKEVAQVNEAQDALRASSQLDGLTGVLNRKALMETLELEMLRSQRFGHGFALLFIDLDRFKQINDTRGHAAGDATLVHAARLLKHAARSRDIVGRYGGEEFMIGLVEPSPEHVLHTAERLRQKIALTSIELPQRQLLHVTASVGIAQLAGPHDSLGAMIDRADRALYRAKQEGRNRVFLAEKQEDSSPTVLTPILGRA